MRCPHDGRFVRRLTKTGQWWMCSGGCKRLTCTDPEVDRGMALMEAWR